MDSDDAEPPKLMDKEGGDPGFSPREKVDEVWHLHLAMKEDYAAACRAIRGFGPDVADEDVVIPHRDIPIEEARERNSALENWLYNVAAENLCRVASKSMPLSLRVAFMLSGRYLGLPTDCG